MQEFQNGQEVMWCKDKVFYVGESQIQGQSIIEVPRNIIRGSSEGFVQLPVETLSLSPVKQKAAASDVESSSSAGCAVLDYFIKNGAFPKIDEEISNVTPTIITQKDLKQLKELLDSEINNWFNKLS